MSSDVTPQNELVPSSDDPAAGGSSSSPAPLPEVIDVEGKGVPVILPAPAYNPKHTLLPAYK